MSMLACGGSRNQRATSRPTLASTKTESSPYSEGVSSTPPANVSLMRSMHAVGLGHLRVDALEDGRLALRDRAHHPQQIRLARREARGLRAEAREVVARARYAHELHAAARSHERVHEQRILLRPGQNGLQT